MALSTSTDLPTAREIEAPGTTPRPQLLNRFAFGFGVAVTATLFFVGAWQRRWIADDGLIVLRTVRNLLVGNGPVFNVNERVETNTSAAWTFLVYFFARITQARLEYVVLTLSLVLSISAIVLGMLGAARLRGGARVGLLLPAGALVYIALPPARDFATSGLESCLVIFWLALVWLLLIRWATNASKLPGLIGLVFTAGLGWLVRPETLIVSGLTLAVVILAPVPLRGRRSPSPWLQRVGLAAIAGFVPVVYQIWRMGYYGLPYPNTAVAKEATGAEWAKGFAYLWDTAGPYWLWLPLVLFLVAALLSGRWHPMSMFRRKSNGQRRGRTLNMAAIRTWQQQLRSPRVAVAVMLLSGVLLLVFVLRVGGDFMHGRVLLPPLFCLLLPIMVVPIAVRGSVKSWLVPLVAWTALVSWAVVVGNSGVLVMKIGRSGIVDERAYYVTHSGHEHPILAEDYLDYNAGWMRAMVKDINSTPGGSLLIASPNFTYWDIDPGPGGDAGHTVYFLNLGMTSMNTPLHVRVIDQEGLAYPLAAHTGRLVDGRIGHDKALAPDWVIADLGLVDKHPWMPPYLNEDWVKEAEVALTCSKTQTLLNSYRGPITTRKFVSNIVHAFGYAKYRIDRVPQYEIERCGLTEPPLEFPRDN